jgi:hypothetical protein
MLRMVLAGHRRLLVCSWTPRPQSRRYSSECKPRLVNYRRIQRPIHRPDPQHSADVLSDGPAVQPRTQAQSSMTSKYDKERHHRLHPSPRGSNMGYFVGICLHLLHLCMCSHRMHKDVECDYSWGQFSTDEIEQTEFTWVSWHVTV